MTNKDNNMTRRGFVAGTALTAGSLSLAGLLGCSPNSRQNTSTAPRNDREDVASELNQQDYSYTSNSIENFEDAVLFSEWKLGPLTLHHRMVKSGAGSDTFNSGLLEEPVAYYTNFAKGGVEMIWTENFAKGISRFNTNPMFLGLDSYPIKEFAQAIHEAGAYVGYSCDTMGTKFSPHMWSNDFDFAATCSLEDVKGLQEDIIQAAITLHEAGFDAFEINAAANNAGQRFLSRAVNNRTDEYGPQSFENRARFVCEIIEEIKKACGDEFIVQVLINAVEDNDGAIGNNSLYTTVEENKEIAKLFEQAGANSIHLRLGPSHNHISQFASDVFFAGRGIVGTTSYGTRFDFSRHFEGKLVSSHSGCGLLLDVAAEIKSAVSIPVGAVTYMDPAQAPDLFEDALAQEKIDFLIMNRPLVVDPQYVNKLREGRIDEIAPCTRCVHCYADFDNGGGYSSPCRVNACSQRAYRDEMPEGYAVPAKEGDKTIAVIGGGPAGMEAARIAAQRGYSVTLYEKQASLGGLLPFASTIKGPHENLDRLLTYLKKQLEIEGVNVQLNTEISESYFTDAAPDAVIVAVGGMRDTLTLEDSSDAEIVSIDDIATAEIGQSVVLVGGGAQAVDTAMYLMEQGKTVNIVMPDTIEGFSKGHSTEIKPYIINALYAQGVRVMPEAHVSSINDGRANVVSSTGVSITLPCDTLVDAQNMVPNQELALALQSKGFEVISVGDCADPYNIQRAISAANLAARHI